MDDQRDIPGSVRCLICLSTFSGQPVATPQPCEHHYCLTCITEWAKTKNSCPVDRLEFSILYQRSRVGGDVQKRLKVELPRDRSLTEEDVADVLSVCEECGRSDQRHRMLLCSGCDVRYHIGCLNPSLISVPSEDWFCQDCTAENRHTNAGMSREDGEIEEAEVMDLLAEVVPTSSRLRPSAPRQPPPSTRRSERVSLQSSRMQGRLSQPVQHVPRYLLKSSCPANKEEAKTNAQIQVKHKTKRR